MIHVGEIKPKSAKEMNKTQKWGCIFVLPAFFCNVFFLKVRFLKRELKEKI